MDLFKFTHEREIPDYLKVKVANLSNLVYQADPKMKVAKEPHLKN